MEQSLDFLAADTVKPLSHLLAPPQMELNCRGSTLCTVGQPFNPLGETFFTDLPTASQDAVGIIFSNSLLQMQHFCAC
jgi:hypothetical protein